MTTFEWIDEKISEGLEPVQIYAMFGDFQEKTGSASKESSFKRLVRRRFFHRSELPKTDDVRVMEEAEGPNKTICTKSSDIRTLEQLLAFTKVDLGQWEVIRHIVNSWGSGENENFQVKAWLSLRKDAINPREEVEQLIIDAKKYSFVYPKISERRGSKSNNMFELAIMDHHFGQLSWGKETGTDYDIKIAARLAYAAVDYQLTRARDFKPEKIVLPIGNDFFNVDNKANTTTRGTPQAEDGRWMKTFPEGRKLWVEIIEKCASLAPVEIPIIRGNHDEERTFFMGDALECWFHNCKDVSIDNSPEYRKYIEWGLVIIGMTHGHLERKGKGVLANLMAIERPMAWAKSKYREWHNGHLHAASATNFQVLDEDLGVRTRILPSLVATDDYHAGKGYSHLRETVGMVWNKEQGMTDMVMYHP